MTKIIIKKSEVLAMQKLRKKINRADLKNIILLDQNEKVINITEQEIDDHRFTGLNNLDLLLKKL